MERVLQLSEKKGSRAGAGMPGTGNPVARGPADAQTGESSKAMENVARWINPSEGDIESVTDRDRDSVFELEDKQKKKSKKPARETTTKAIPAPILRQRSSQSLKSQSSRSLSRSSEDFKAARPRKAPQPQTTATKTRAYRTVHDNGEVEHVDRDERMKDRLDALALKQSRGAQGQSSVPFLTGKSASKSYSMIANLQQALHHRKSQAAAPTSSKPRVDAAARDAQSSSRETLLVLERELSDLNEQYQATFRRHQELVRTGAFHDEAAVEALEGQIKSLLGAMESKVRSSYLRSCLLSNVIAGKAALGLVIAAEAAEPCVRGVSAGSASKGSLSRARCIQPAIIMAWQINIFELSVSIG